MKSVITSVVCAGLAVSLPCAAGGQESPSESLLELRLSTDKSSIILTEPINVRFHLMNLKGEPFAIDNLFDYKGVLGAQFGKKGARRLKPFNLPLSGYRKGPQTVPIEGLYYDLLMAFDPHAGSPPPPNLVVHRFGRPEFTNFKRGSGPITVYRFIRI